MANEVAAPPKRKKLGLLVWSAVAALAVAGGGVAPWVYSWHEHGEKKAASAPAAKPVVVTFGDVVVNLGEERLTRYLRARVLLVVQETDEKEINELLTKQKPFLKSWLIGHLADQTLQDVGRNLGVNRIRREIRDQFNAMLYPDGSEKIQDVLFDEFVVQ
jgi:flagellar basal body-associated protein FliL